MINYVIISILFNSCLSKNESEKLILSIIEILAEILRMTIFLKNDFPILVKQIDMYVWIVILWIYSLSVLENRYQGSFAFVAP